MELTTGFLDRLAPAKQKELGESPGAGDSSVASVSAYQGANYLSPLGSSQLREWSESNWALGVIIAQRCQDVAGADFVITWKDQKGPKDEALLEEITSLFDAPDADGKNNAYWGLTHAVTRDVCVLDQGVVRPLKYADGAIYALRDLDGALVDPRPGWQSEADGWRYTYRDPRRGGRPTNLDNDQLIVISANPRTYAPTGLAPLKVLNRILIAEYDAFRSMHSLQKTRSPSAILKVPNASKEVIDQITVLFEEELAGKSGFGVMNIPAESDLLEVASANLEQQGAFAFYDMLVNAMSASFQMPTLNLNWLQNVNRATATASTTAVYDRGKLNLLRLWQNYWNLEVIKSFPGADNICLRYTALMTKEEALAVTTIREMAGRGLNWAAINDMREAQGQEKISGRPAREQMIYDYPLVQVAPGQMAPAPWLPYMLPYQLMGELPTEFGDGPPGITAAPVAPQVTEIQGNSRPPQPQLPAPQPEKRIPAQKDAGGDAIFNAQGELVAELDRIFDEIQQHGKDSTRER